MRERLACGGFKPVDARPVIDVVAAMFAQDDTPVLAFQRVAGNAHELDALRAELRKVQAHLSVTEDDDALDALVAQRKAIKARIEGFVVVPDSFDYAPTSRTVAQLWNDGDDTVKRGMVQAVKTSWGLALADHHGGWAVAIGTAAAPQGEGTDDNAPGIVDLGGGLCFHREGARAAAGTRTPAGQDGR